MGLEDRYKLPENYNAAYHLAGDGVVVPVVGYLSAHVLEPLLQANAQPSMRVVPSVRMISIQGRIGGSVKNSYCPGA